MPSNVENFINEHDYGRTTDRCFNMGIAGACPCLTDCVFDISQKACEIYDEDHDAGWSCNSTKERIMEELPDICDLNK